MSEFDTRTKQYTGRRWTYQYDARGTAIGEFVLFTPSRGIVIERDGTQGNLAGFKRLFEVELGPPGPLAKTDLVDLIAIPDPAGISTSGGLPCDVGLGDPFAFPFVTIESVLVMGPDLLAVVNDNNYPFSIGRHVGAAAPDDMEFILIRLPERL